MPAIFGMTPGNPEELTTMFQSLLHRGKDKYLHFNNQNSFLGFSIDQSDALNSVSSGIIEKDNIIFSVAGNITDLNNNLLSIKQLFDLYEKEALPMLQNIKGAYVMAIQDGKSIHLVRDPSGLRTLFYSIQGKSFYYSIESKGISSHVKFNRHINYKALAQYLTFSFIPLENTMMDDIFELPAGTIISYHLESHKTSSKRYFKVEKIEKKPVENLNYWIDQLREEIDFEIKKVINLNKPFGVFLSGGLDSSIITARAAALSESKVNTYSIHFGPKYRNELEFAQMVAKMHNTNHEEVIIKPKNFVPKLRKTIWHLDDPIGDPITIPNFELAQYVSENAGIVLNGEGGDPCFGGPKNIPMLINHWYTKNRDKNYREKAYLASYQRGYKWLKNILSGEMLEYLDEKEDLESILTPFFNSPNQNFLDKLMTINIRLKGAHLILPKVERMLGASGVNSVSPMFTSEVIKLSMEMPSVFKLNDGIEKYILKEAYKNEVPLPIIQRPKSGMRVPVQYWFKGEMKRYARKLLDPKRIKKEGIFNYYTIQDLLKYDMEKSLRRHGMLLWMLMTFEIWRRIFIEKEPI